MSGSWGASTSWEIVQRRASGRRRWNALKRDRKEARRVQVAKLMRDYEWPKRGSQNAIARLDKKSGKFQMWSTPKEWDTDAGQLGHLATEGAHVDNKVWIKNSDVGNIYRLDVASNKFENLGNFKDPKTGKRIGTYGIHSDAQNNAYLLDFSAGQGTHLRDLSGNKHYGTAVGGT